MATFKSYGTAFSIPDRYATGHAVSEAEADVLNKARADAMSQRLRTSIFSDLSQGDTPSEELIAAANAYLAEHEPGFTFTMGRTVTPADPVEAESKRLAEIEVDKALAKANLRRGKRAVAEKTAEDGTTTPAQPEETGDGIYPYSAYRAKVAEIAKADAIVKQARKNVANAETPKVEINLAA